MNHSVNDRILNAHESLPESVRSRPATEVQLYEFEQEFGPIHEDYRWYLLTCGGGVAGPECLDNIDELAETHRKFRVESEAEGGWTMADFFVIAYDGAGNPFGIERSTGKILVEDYDFGGIHVMAESLAALLLAGLCES